MCGGNVSRQKLPFQGLTAGLQAQPEVTQGPHEVEPLDGVDVVEAIADRTARGGRDDPAIGLEADCLHRETGAPGRYTNRVERAVHGPRFRAPLLEIRLLASCRNRDGPGAPRRTGAAAADKHFVLTGCSGSAQWLLRAPRVAY